MLRYDFHQSLTFWVYSTAQALERALNEELAPHGITYRQWQVLGWLAYEGELSQVELAERMRIEAPTLAGILDRMERDGWLVRRECPGDRRKKLVRPTERVAPVWETIADAARRVRARAAGRLGPERLAELLTMLQAVQRNLLGDDAIPPPGPPPEASPQQDSPPCPPARSRR